MQINTLKVEFDAGDCNSRIITYLHNKPTKYNTFDILKNEIYKSILGNNCVSEYLNMADIEQESECLDIIKDNGIDGLALQRFLGFYLKSGLSEVNYGRDSRLLDAILLNISSMIGIGYGAQLPADDDSIGVKEVTDAFDSNYESAGDSRKIAINTAFVIDNYISDLYK